MATEVSDYSRNTQPYSCIGLINVTFPDGYAARGTATLVGRNDILTATHVVYSPDHGGWAEDFHFYFGADYNDVTNRFEDYGYAYSPTKYITSAWPTQAFSDAYDQTMIQSEAQYDVAIIGVNTPIGDSLGWLGMASGYNGGYVANAIGYPSGATGMMEETVYVRENYYYGLYESSSNVLGPGSSGGPLLIDDYVTGVKSTGTWWADIGFLYNLIVEKMDENNSLLSTSFIDPAAPVFLSSSPTDGATEVSTTANIQINFNETIQLGSGSIVIKTAAGTPVETFDVGTSNHLSISGSTLTINPTSTLVNSTKYYVIFDYGTIGDLVGNAYAGTESYDFTTAVDTGGKENVLPGFDKAYYLNAKLAALQANSGASGSWIDKGTAFLENLLISLGFTAESHYMAFGYKEGLAPNAYFNAVEYKQAKAATLFTTGNYDSVAAAQAAFDANWPHDPFQHYLQYGSREGINPSNSFDESSYYESKLIALRSNSITNGEWTGKTAIDLKTYFDSLGITPLEHYIMYGANEGIAVTVVPAGERMSSAMFADDAGLNQTNINLAGVMVSSDPEQGR